MRLTAIGPAISGKQEYWVYRCSCGSVKTLTRRSVIAGKIKSCGCLNTELRNARNLKHGGAFRGKPTRTYTSWYAMRRRCNNPKNRDYKWYGALGVTVCDRWLGEDGFANFLSDMGERPIGRTLDRFPNRSGNYQPENCRWATIYQQHENKRQRKSASYYVK